jgi:hypothetical protein
MSSAPEQPPATHAPPPPRPAEDTVEIRIVSHSNLFYWWPVWAMGFVMTILTFIDNHRMAIVPGDADVQKERDVAGQKVDVITVPIDEKHHNRRTLFDEETGKPKPLLHMAASKSYGVIFCITLLLCIVITNVPMRGLWSVVVIVFIVLLTVILALAGWWEHIFHQLDRLAIHINAAGYLFISVALFAIWLITFLFFDTQIYMVFTPGQLKVCTEIGGGETAYDTTGMTIQKQRSDLFRHWILGLGSGDLIVNTAGAQVHHFDLPNVLFVGKKVQQIEDMLREKAVVRGRS